MDSHFRRSIELSRKVQQIGSKLSRIKTKDRQNLQKPLRSRRFFLNADLFAGMLFDLLRSASENHVIMETQIVAKENNQTMCHFLRSIFRSISQFVSNFRNKTVQRHHCIRPFIEISKLTQPIQCVTTNTNSKTTG